MSKTFAARLNRLFDTVYPPGRGPHTSAEVIAALKAEGVDVSARGYRVYRAKPGRRRRSRIDWDRLGRIALVLVTGEHESDRKGVAKALEGKLFEDGKVVYFLGIGNVLYGVDADLKASRGAPLDEVAAALA